MIRRPHLFLCIILFAIAGASTSIYTNNWHTVEQKTYQAVVQVFAQIAQFNWLEPYRTPEQFAARGSGFFIDDNGLIITNAHVVEQSVGVWIQMPSCGKRLLSVDIVKICPDEDIAFLQLNDEDCAYVRSVLNKIPYLPIGDSDRVCRADEVIAFGYPLGQESLKSLSGIISGYQHIHQFNRNFLQTDVAINKGQSGGPLLDVHGHVIGINTASVTDAQNVGYAIPINSLKIILDDVSENTIVRKPFTGLITMKVNNHIVESMGNPLPGGAFIAEVVTNSLADMCGMQHGDMVYAIDGHPVDIYGEVSVSRGMQERMSISDYVSLCSLHQDIVFDIYRQGEQKRITMHLDYANIFPIKEYYPWFEIPEYEVFGGMVIMPLTMNHIQLLQKDTPYLTQYIHLTQGTKEPVLLITHIFPNAEVARIRSIEYGFIIDSINGIKVHTLKDFRQVITDHQDDEYLSITCVDTVTGLSNRLPVVLPLRSMIQETKNLASLYRYTVPDWIYAL